MPFELNETMAMADDSSLVGREIDGKIETEAEGMTVDKEDKERRLATGGAAFNSPTP